MSNQMILKQARQLRRRTRIRSRISGTAERPRLNVFRSAKHISAQLIDDVSGRTLAQASDRQLPKAQRTKSESAAAVGALIAEQAKAVNISWVVFDRGGHLYHGRIKAVADAARQNGLQF